jgi:hypothetical protein
MSTGSVWHRTGAKWQAFVNRVMNSISIKGREILDQLSDSQLFKQDYAVWGIYSIDKHL